MLLPRMPSLWTDFCLGALFHTYTFLYNNLTKLHPADDTEFAVMITENQSKSCRESILALGARVIDVPIIPSPRGFQHKYDYTYTKYQMWAMEGIYEKILYLDGDLLYFTKSPLPIFKEIDVFHDEMENRLREERGDESGDSMAPYTSTKRYFYGGSQDWQMSCINGGLLLLEPNLKDYQGLIDLMPSTLGFGDQKTLDEYFKANTDRAGIHLSRVYNTQWVHHRTQQELVSAVGFHHKFFDDRIGDKPEGIKTFERFSRGFLDLRKIQLENFEAGRGGNLPIVPAVPNSFDGMVAVRKSRAKFDRLAILTIGGVNTTSEKSRKKFASHYSQAVDIGSTSFDTLAEKIGYVSNILLPKYEWVFVVNGRLILHRTHLPIHVALSRWIDNDTELIVFKDCPAELSGSFIVGRAARETLSKLYDDHRDKSMSDSDFWKLLIEQGDGKSHKNALSPRRALFFRRFGLFNVL
ncbi:hypothetical protein BDR26DRAFT_605614 [Obelidium mucronatum]|nr:hypothetical protein BDR26DRAFT_605614 [Obelidium mucronatum]